MSKGCGQKMLPSMTHCPHCGEQLLDKKKFDEAGFPLLDSEWILPDLDGRGERKLIVKQIVPAERLGRQIQGVVYDAKKIDDVYTYEGITATKPYSCDLATFHATWAFLGEKDLTLMMGVGDGGG